VVRGVLVLVGVALLGACHHPPEPIRIEGRQIIVENLTRDEWRNVTVTVNAYYRAGARTIAPGGRLEGRLGDLVTGLGQRFDVNRERVWRIEVRAASDAGPVALDWSNENRR
jgi:hypothetical protein